MENSKILYNTTMEECMLHSPSSIGSRRRQIHYKNPLLL